MCCVYMWRRMKFVCVNINVCAKGYKKKKGWIYIYEGEWRKRMCVCVCVKVRGMWILYERMYVKRLTYRIMNVNVYDEYK